jgi:ferredoxin
MASMTVRVDKDRCIMAGNCLFKAPTVFTQDDDGYVELLTTEVAPEVAEEVRDAVRSCPGAAIFVE